MKYIFYDLFCPLGPASETSIPPLKRVHLTPLNEVVIFMWTHKTKFMVSRTTFYRGAGTQGPQKFEVVPFFGH